MADLVSKYFQEDLSEAEDQALSETLRNSPEDSLRFEEGLRQAYVRYGLPDPQWPGEPHDYPRLRGGAWGGTWVWVTLGATLTAALGWYFLKKDWSVLHPPVRLPAPLHQPSGASKPKPHADSHPGHPAGSSTPPQAAAQTAFPRPSTIQGTGNPPESPASSNATQAHQGLEVTVRQAIPGQVTVRVLGADGSQAALLYQGPLAAGKWAFDWDGKLTDGSPAQPGSYQIQVTSGNTTKEKIVFIRKHGPE